VLPEDRHVTISAHRELSSFEDYPGMIDQFHLTTDRITMLHVCKDLRSIAQSQYKPYLTKRLFEKYIRFNFDSDTYYFKEFKAWFVFSIYWGMLDCHEEMQEELLVFYQGVQKVILGADFSTQSRLTEVVRKLEGLKELTVQLPDTFAVPGGEDGPKQGVLAMFNGGCTTDHHVQDTN
jgi:hypothetical protein